VPHNKGESKASAFHNIETLNAWWLTKKLSEVTEMNCKAYAKYRARPREIGGKVRRGVRPASSRRELAILSAAIGHWHAAHGPLTSVPVVWLPPKPASRDRWLDRSEAALLLAGSLGFYREFWTDVTARREHFRWRRYSDGINRHLTRFILLGLYTGSRKGVCLSVQWSPNVTSGWVDLVHGVLYRKSHEEEETKKKKPPSRLGRRIQAHLRRWKRMDDAARNKAANAGNKKWATLYRNVVTWRGKPVNSVRTAWDAAIEFAWLDGKVIRHTLRHTRATWLMQKGVDRWEAAGHIGMSVQMLEEVYGHHHPDWQKEAAEV
jgi:integrase